VTHSELLGQQRECRADDAEAECHHDGNRSEDLHLPR
jgi:hypothetical protein